MDGRTGFAMGGFIVGAAVVAVASAVTLSNSAALADVPGAAVGADVVRVTPSALSASPTPRASAPVASPLAPSPVATAEVVPAPEPRDVAAHAPAAPVAEAPTAPAPAPAAPAADQGLSRHDVEAKAVQSGSWDELRAWGAANGWTPERVERWIGNLKTRMDRDAATPSTSEQKSSSTDLQKTPAEAGDEHGKSSGSKRAQSPQPPRGD